MPDLYRYPCTILRVEERKQTIYVSGAGDTAVFETKSLGWFAVLDLGISLSLGFEKPELPPGACRLTLEKL